MCTELLEMCGRDMHVWASICAHACGSVTPAPPRLHRLAQHQSPFGGGLLCGSWAGARQLHQPQRPSWPSLGRWPGASLSGLHFFMQQRSFRAALRAPLSQIRESGCYRGAARGGAGAQVPWAGAAELGLGPRLRVTSLKIQPWEASRAPPTTSWSPACAGREGCAHDEVAIQPNGREGLDFWGCVSRALRSPRRGPPSLFLLFLSLPPQG